MTRDELILNNLGLVGSCASRFIGKGIDYEDLYSSGCVGLIKAADGFDDSLGFAFSTYAVPSILGEIRRLFRDGGAVKISRTLKEKARQLQFVKENLEKQFGVEPTISEIANEMGLSIPETAQLIAISQPVISLTSDNDAIHSPLSLAMVQYIHRCPFFAILSKFRPFHLQYGMKSL